MHCEVVSGRVGIAHETDSVVQLFRTAGGRKASARDSAVNVRPQSIQEAHGIWTWEKSGHRLTL
ncbi:hypothetical protein L226DRAFT_533326 [Lentinus tigrinus ALCF2SS1-7]|uniref:uncharacterized protein n=1 Tax=Lentinus tigrinus ALCF2SS1-7 TaxID=1328758 RepID=UPI001165C8CA|nr:hypothetical protein L226DRAFT_541144 [Lentinus tigrinus ALCF2SS1-7]RPD67943.1 hypothetical protein L226DRAFT_541117 [Lentinus tigrinus ALCF2SS1-7]RPD77328.1 hypothetical protein L226DRAFT_533326 [Lentinus tigrinus ALCF2SS1-7]